MADILIIAPPDFEQTVSLDLGRYTIGSEEGCDIEIEDGTVLAAHCELVVDPVCVRINTLDPRAAVLLNGQPVSSSLIPPGALVAVGSYQLQVLDGAGAASGGAPFGSLVKAAFTMPVAPGGLAMIVSGAVVFTLLDIVSAFAGFIGLLLSLAVSGYVLAFAKSVLTSAAHGEKHLPNWPGLDDGLSDVFGSLLQFVVVLLALFGPAVAVFTLAPDWWPAGLGLVAIGLVLMPVTLLAVSLFDSMGVLLNLPALVRAMCLMRGHYAVVLAVLAATLAAFVGYAASVAILVPIPIVSDILVSLVHLYLLIVWMRLIGSLYCLHGGQFGWGG